MKLSVSQKLTKTDAICVFLPSKKWSPAIKKSFGSVLPKSIEDEIVARWDGGEFDGKLGSAMWVFPEKVDAARVLLVGTGDGEQIIEWRKAAGVAIRAAKKAKAKKVTFIAPKTICAQRLVSGAILGNYEFKIGDTSERFEPKSLTIVTADKISKSDIDAEAAVAAATCFTRDLVNRPANHLTPEMLAAEAQAITKISKKIKVTVLDRKKIEKLKMGALMGVAQGATHDPRLVVLEYRGGKKSDAPVALVGKGVCFDSGGYNLKPTGHIETMHQDMAGAATVLGAFHWLAKMQPKTNVVGVIGAVENMISGTAYRPGDIITAMNGQTIRITNTDAEGRLVLADCLHYCATKFKPARMLDFATLTGACVAALGYEITGFMGNDDALKKDFQTASDAVDELAWELPLIPLFDEKIKDTEADLQNWTAGVSAGSSVAGAFLKNFVGETPWVHVDIAGTAYHEKAGDELAPRGATGVVIRTLAEMLS